MGRDAVIDAPRLQRGHALRSVQPDAFGILRRGERTWPFFLEWERRAVRPVTTAARLAPYLRYYSSERPLEDHGAWPSVLVVFETSSPGSTSGGWHRRRWSERGSTCRSGFPTGLS